MRGPSVWFALSEQGQARLSSPHPAAPAKAELWGLQGPVPGRVPDSSWAQLAQLHSICSACRAFHSPVLLRSAPSPLQFPFISCESLALTVVTPWEGQRGGRRDRQHQPCCLFDSSLGWPIWARVFGLFSQQSCVQGCAEPGCAAQGCAGGDEEHPVLVGSGLIQHLPAAGGGVGSLLCDSRQELCDCGRSCSLSASPDSRAVCPRQWGG